MEQIFYLFREYLWQIHAQFLRRAQQRNQMPITPLTNRSLESPIRLDLDGLFQVVNCFLGTYSWIVHCVDEGDGFGRVDVHGLGAAQVEEA